MSFLIYCVEGDGKWYKIILEYMLINKGDSLDHITWYILILVMIINIITMY